MKKYLTAFLAFSLLNISLLFSSEKDLVNVYIDLTSKVTESQKLLGTFDTPAITNETSCYLGLFYGFLEVRTALESLFHEDSSSEDFPSKVQTFLDHIILFKESAEKTLSLVDDSESLTNFWNSKIIAFNYSIDLIRQKLLYQ